MTFLAPSALIGLMLLVVPIVAHLFRPRKTRRVAFSSLRWLEASHLRKSRRIQWHRWPLFLLRAAVIVLLVLAAAKPWLSGRGHGAPADRVLIVDASRSMACQPGDRTAAGLAPWERARDTARQLLTAQPGDRTAVIAVDRAARILAPLSAEPSVAEAALRTLEPSHAGTRLGAALPLVPTLLGPASDARPLELIVVTDHHVGAWQPQDVSDFLSQAVRPQISVRVITVNAAAANGWIVGARWASDASGTRSLLVDLAASGDAPQPRQVRLVGGAVQPVTLAPGRVARVSLPLDAEPADALELRLEPPDALPSDDTYFVAPQPAHATRVLLIEPTVPGRDGRSAGVFLRSALVALDSAEQQSLAVTPRTTASVTAGDLLDADVVLLAGAAPLADAVVETLAARVRAGAGAAVFLGPEFDRDFARDRLVRPSQVSESLLPFAVEEIVSPPERRTWSATDASHPLLAPLLDPVQSDLTLTAATQLGRGTVAPGSRVLAAWSDGTPLLVEGRLGDGRVVVLNASANDEWTDLPLRRSFVPLVNRLVSYLAGQDGRTSFVVGEPATLRAPEDGVVPTLVTPSGKRLAVRNHGQALRTAPLPEPGIYRREGHPAPAFVANVAPGDSRLTAEDADAVRQMWSPAKVEIASADDRESVAGRTFGAKLSAWLLPALIVAAGLLLATETVYSATLCPGGRS